MINMLSSSYFWIGLVAGIAIMVYLAHRKKMCNKIGFVSAKRLSEELLTAYRNEDLKGIEQYRESYLEKDESVFLFEKKEGASPFQLWTAIVIYVTRRYADYDFNPYDSDEWKDIVAKTFGNKSLAYNKYVAIDEILNRSTKYYMTSYGWIKNEKNTRGDYADDSLYEMIGYIIKSSFEKDFEFGKYSDVEDPKDKYDDASYAIACIQLKNNNNLEGIKNLEKAALSGMPEAQCRLGLIYSMGERVRQNKELAHQWFLKSAENGDAMGMFFVGSSYYEGTRSEKDIDKAMYWLKMSAEKGYDQAQDLLGVIYINGKEVAKDVDKGKDLITKAANQNNPHSQYILAVMYARGVDVTYDKEKAIYWIDKAISTDKAYETEKDDILEFIKQHEG